MASQSNVRPREIRIERVQIAADGGVTVDLTEFDGVVSLSRQQIGELVGRVAALTWREAAARVLGCRPRLEVHLVDYAPG